MPDFRLVLKALTFPLTFLTGQCHSVLMNSCIAHYSMPCPSPCQALSPLKTRSLHHIPYFKLLIPLQLRHYHHGSPYL